MKELRILDIFYYMKLFEIREIVSILTKVRGTSIIYTIIAMAIKWASVGERVEAMVL